eukprot:COSAG01_NODE_30728_length_610_cov_1.706458_1_plen_64_part_10
MIDALYESDNLMPLGKQQKTTITLTPHPAFRLVHTCHWPGESLRAHLESGPKIQQETQMGRGAY